MSKYIDLIGWEDVPHLQPPHITKQELDDLERDMLPHQKQARRTGRPSLGAGAIYPVDYDNLVCDPFRIPEFWERAWAIDVGWRRTAALVGAKDPDTDVYYLTHEYYVGEAKPLEHSFGIKAILPWPDLAGAMDPAAKGSNQKDGSKLKEEYEDLGLELVKADNAVHAGIHRVLTLMQGGQLKVFSTLVYWKKEHSLYRRDAKGKIVKENDHLMDCTRYLLKTDDLFTTRPMSDLHNEIRGEW
jgi:hypothetical protein